MKLSSLPFLIFLLFCLQNHSTAQSITINGQVTDSHTEEPVPFATIYLQSDHGVGVSADFDGNYEFKLNERPDSLAISALGYDTKIIVYDGQENLPIELDGTAYNFDEIIIRPTEDPAVALMKKVIKFKDQNDPRNIDQYECEVYNKLEMDLVNISEGFQNLKINRPIKFAFSQIDSTSEELPFLPIFLTETLSDYYYKRKPKTDKEILKASKVSGLENASLSELLDILYERFNIYDNWIPVLTKEFASPISDAGFTYYNYYIVDSAMIHDMWSYQIQFFPKSKSTKTFTGNFWINDSLYSVERVQLKLFENVDINFIQKISIVQNFIPFQGRFRVPQQAYTVVTFDKITKPLLLDWFSKKIEKNAPNAQGKRTTSYSNYKVSVGDLDSITSAAKVPKESLKKDDTYWASNRHKPLTANEKQVQTLIDTIQQLNAFEVWKRWTTLLFSGHMPVGPFDIGNVYTFYSWTPIDGTRLKLGLRTNSKFSKNFLIAGYAAYGLRDKRWKFGLNSLLLFNKSPRRTLSATVIQDVGLNPFLSSDFSLSSDGVLGSNFIRRGKVPMKMLDLEHYRLSYFHEQIPGLSFQFSAEHQYTRPYFNFSYQTDDSDTYDADQIDRYRYSALDIRIRFAHKEKFLGGVFSRVSLGSQSPILTLNYKVGVKDFLDGGFNFHRLDLSIYDRWNMGSLGYMNNRLTAGKVFGRLPYFLLHVAGGNEGIISNYNGYNLINNFTYISDTYTQLHLDYHLDGLLFERLPLLKRLNWRAVSNFRILWGTLSDENRTANAANFVDVVQADDLVGIDVPDDEPYMEVSAGIENILRIIRLDMIWKVSRQNPGDKNWGIRGNIHIKF